MSSIARLDLRQIMIDLMMIPGLSGHEDRVRRAIAARLAHMGIKSETDRLGNLSAHFPGAGPKVMLFTHMDQLGFIVRRIDPDGFIWVTRLGGVPERALAAQAVLICIGEGRDVPGVIANKSHHATGPDDKTRVLATAELYIDAGFANAKDAAAAGVRIGAPVVYAPKAVALGANRIAGTSVDDRAGCAALLAVAQALANRENGPPVDIVFTVQEEFNLRGALPIAQELQPDIAMQIDLMLASDTPDMADVGDIALGAGPAISLYSFHGRGTLNGVIPHPALTALMEETAAETGINLQRSAQVGILTDLSYVQHVGAGVAALDVGFPMRYSHSALEVVDLRDVDGLVTVLTNALSRISPEFSLDRDMVT